jgi:mRNA interferase RelE/StbE
MDEARRFAEVKVLVSEQILVCLRGLHPDHRRDIRSALRELAKGKGDVKELEGRLAEFYRLRIGRYRIVFRYRDKHIEAFFLEQRSIVYELFRP